MLKKHLLAGIVQYRAFGKGNVRTDARYDDARLEAVLQVVKERFLHHVRHFVACSNEKVMVTSSPYEERKGEMHL